MQREGEAPAELFFKRRCKRVHVSGAALFRFVGEIPPTDKAGWKFERNVSRTTADGISPSSTLPGAKVWFTAFWFNPRKQNGPACAAVGTHIAGGSVMLKAA